MADTAKINSFDGFDKLTVVSPSNHKLRVDAERSRSIKGTLTAFVVGQSQISRTAKQMEQLDSLRSAPHYFGAIVPAQKIIGTEEREIRGKKISFTVKAYMPDIIIAEAEVPLDDIFNESNLDLREELTTSCREILQKHKAKKETDEEYGVWAIGDYDGSADTFLVYDDKIAGLLKSEKQSLDEKEIEATMQSSIKYARNDLTIVDWDGAFVFDPEGHFGSALEMFEIANAQLLRYRILDNELEERMKRINRLLREMDGKRKLALKSREVRQAVRELIAIRSASVLEFESTERDIKLIGDWYSARLYDLVAKKFHFDDWRQRIQLKLDSIEDIYSMISENFNVSLRARLETVSLVGWLILMVGWFILIVFEFAGLFR